MTPDKAVALLDECDKLRIEISRIRRGLQPPVCIDDALAGALYDMDRGRLKELEERLAAVDLQLYVAGWRRPRREKGAGAT